MLRVSDHIEPIQEVVTPDVPSEGDHTPKLGPFSVSVPSEQPTNVGARPEGLEAARRTCRTRTSAKAVLYELDLMETARRGQVLYQGVIDLSQQPFYKLLMPEYFYPESFCNHLERCQFINEQKARSDLVIKCSALGLGQNATKTPEGKKVFAALDVMSDVRNLLDPLNRMGKDFRAEYEQAIGEPLPDIRVEKVCEVQTHEYTVKTRSMLGNKLHFHSPCRREEAEQQTLVLPRRNFEWKSSRLKSHKILKRLIKKKLHSFGIKGKERELLGLVPSAIADPEVRKSAFTDSHWSLNLLHGNETHWMQLALLADMGAMDRKALSWMIDHDLWGPILDQNLTRKYEGYTIVDPTDEDQKILTILQSDEVRKVSRLIIKGTGSSLSAHAPESLHHKFLSGGFSSAIRQLSKELDASGRRQLLETVLGISVDGDDESNKVLLAEVEKNLAAIEWSVTEKQFHSMDNMAEFMGRGSGEALFDDCRTTAGDFCISDDVQAVIREKAKRHLKKGRRVCGANSETQRLEKLKASSDVEKYQSFVVYRE